jgi:hypothetical protein
MPPSYTDSTSVQLEKTREILPDLFERNDTLWALMKVKGDVEKVSPRAMRLPFKTLPAGKFRQTDFDGADLGLGSSGKYTNGTITPLDFVTAVQTTKKQEYATDSKEKALFMVTKKDVGDAMWTLRASLDILLQTPGTGQIGILKSGSGTNSWTLDAPFGAALILEGMTVNLYDTTFATKRVGDYVVQTVDIENNIITVDQHTNAADTDLLVIEGLSGANPVSLFGLPYHHSNAATGTWLGLDRSLVPGIRTPAVNANGGTLTPFHLRLALNKSRLRLGVDSNPGEFFWYGHVAQEHAYEDIAEAQIQILKQNNANEGYEPFFRIESMAGVKFKPALHADPSRLDAIRIADWGRAEMKPIDYVKWGEGLYTLPLYGTSGGLKAAQIWYLGVSMQIWCDNPRAGTYIYGLQHTNYGAN